MDTVSTILIVIGVWLFIGLIAGIGIGKVLRRNSERYQPRHRAVQHNKPRRADMQSGRRGALGSSLRDSR